MIFKHLRPPKFSFSIKFKLYYMYNSFEEHIYIKNRKVFKDNLDKVLIKNGN